MTEEQKYEIVKRAHPDWSDAKINAAVKEFKVLESGLAGASIAKALINFAKTFGKSGAAKEGAEEAVKKTGKKIVTKKRVLGAVALGGGAEIYNRMTKDGAEAQTPEEMAQASLAMAAATLQETGGDPNSILGTPLAQQMNITTGADLSTLAATYGVNLGGVGVYTGETEVKRLGPKGRPVYGTKTMSLADWNKQFPIADPKELAAFKQRVIAAGVVSAGAGVTQLKAAWEALGQLSVDAARSGAKMTPWQMLDIQRGLFGGGDEDAPSYSLTYTPAEAVKNIYGSALAKGTGRVATAEEEAAFVAGIKAKEGKAPTKSETKIINGKKVRVTTPGFTDEDILTAAERQAQKDPRYAEYQTATVFGDALSKALGVRG